jgi:hypothetical protein
MKRGVITPLEPHWKFPVIYQHHFKPYDLGWPAIKATEILQFRSKFG